MGYINDNKVLIRNTEAELQTIVDRMTQSGFEEGCCSIFKNQDNTYSLYVRPIDRHLLSQVERSELQEMTFEDE